MANMCEGCDRRALVNLNRSLGNEGEAKRLESVGCPWWWGINYTNQQTGVSNLVYDCGIPHLAKMSMDQGARVEEAAQSVQQARNEIARMKVQVESLFFPTSLGIGSSDLLLGAEELPLSVRVSEP